VSRSGCLAAHEHQGGLQQRLAPDAAGRLQEHAVAHVDLRLLHAVLDLRAVEVVHLHGHARVRAREGRARGRQQAGRDQRRRAHRERLLARLRQPPQRLGRAVELASTRVATGTKARPCTVSDTARVVRSNSRQSSCDSMSRSMLLSPACVMCSCSAARVKLCSRAMARKALIWRWDRFMKGGRMPIDKGCLSIQMVFRFY
jgi:hypothetical protein